MIFRINKNDNYVIIHKDFLNDEDLSWQAKGMLAYMLSLPNDWQFSVKDLAKRSKNGRDATQSIIDELVSSGYIVKHQTRGKDGKFGNVDFDVFESKHPCPENPEPVPPCPENPEPGSPSTGKPFTENPDLLSNKVLSNKSTKSTTATTAAPKKPMKWPGAYYKAFSQFPSPLMAEQIQSYIDDGIEDESICLIIGKAGRIGARPPYVTKVLKEWLRAGIRAPDEAQADMDRHENRGNVQAVPVLQSQEVLYSSEELGF